MLSLGEVPRSCLVTLLFPSQWVELSSRGHDQWQKGWKGRSPGLAGQVFCCWCGWQSLPCFLFLNNTRAVI